MRGISPLRLVAFLAAALLIAAPSLHAQSSPEWDQAVAAADREGSIVINMPAGNALRDFLAGEWPKTFPKISLVTNSIDEGTWIARVRLERQSGKFLWDASLSGSVTAYTMKNDGFVLPIPPQLVLADVKDPKTWGGWDRVFWDNEHRYVMATQNFLKMPFYNAKLVPPEKVAAEGAKIFLDPILKKKVIWNDPLMPGSGETFALVMRKRLGDEGLKTFIDNQVAFTPNMMDLVEKMVRGQFAMSLGPSMDSFLRRYKDAGLEFDIRPLGQTVALGAYSNSGGSNLIMMKDAPHPNAAKVFVNWLLSKDIATRLALAQNQDSNRVDVPSPSPANEQPLPGIDYIAPQREASVKELHAAHDLIRQIRSAK
ncbi:MAG TPA: extracellular solute-binding protein [Stellaceae bacterium]|jgi:iron(III) transport system substrate-binding protein|nr:extracellular solute-binding protein [Stellaceae bacterium]